MHSHDWLRSSRQNRIKSSCSSLYAGRDSRTGFLPRPSPVGRRRFSGLQSRYYRVLGESVKSQRVSCSRPELGLLYKTTKRYWWMSGAYTDEERATLEMHKTASSSGLVSDAASSNLADSDGESLCVSFSKSIATNEQIQVDEDVSASYQSVERDAIGYLSWSSDDSGSPQPDDHEEDVYGDWDGAHVNTVRIPYFGSYVLVVLTPVCRTTAMFLGTGLPGAPDAAPVLFEKSVAGAALTAKSERRRSCEMSGMEIPTDWTRIAKTRESVSTILRTTSRLAQWPRRPDTRMVTKTSEPRLCHSFRSRTGSLRFTCIYAFLFNGWPYLLSGLRRMSDFYIILAMVLFGVVWNI